MKKTQDEHHLIADCFQNDPRIQQAKKLIQEALLDAQKTLEGVRAPAAVFADDYAAMLQRCSEARGGNLYYPYLGSGFGKGALVELADGSVKYDFISGIGPHYWGHCHPDMIDAGVDAAISDTLMQGNLQQNVDSLKLLELINGLAQQNGADLAHCFLSTSGASANENALKIILQKHAPADRILCFEKCFSGRTLALAQMTDKAAYRQGLPVALAVDYVPFYDAEHPEESTAKAIQTLKHHLKRFPGKYAGMCLELIQGEAGYFPGSHDFFVEIFKVLRAEGIAIWIDEIQTFGRTSKPFAFQHFELDKWVDVVTIGKLSQVCATLFTPSYKPGPGLLSQTFTGSTSSIAAAIKIFEAFKEGDFFDEQGKINQCHQRFVGHLEMLEAKYPKYVNGPFGIGAMIAFTVFNGDFKLAKAFTDRLFDAGVIAFLAGSEPTRVRFLMPIAAVTEADIDAVAAIIESVLKDMIAEQK